MYYTYRYKENIEFAINLFKSIPQDGPLELAYSGGKDSDVLLQLARESGVEFTAIYKNTTIDLPGTIAHCHENGVLVKNPPFTFLDIIERNGFPSRFRRFCCGYLKEYKIHDRCVLGIRKDESPSRKKRYKEPEMCRVYDGGAKVKQYFPMLDWNLAHVYDFIIDRGIKLHPLYYDDDGKIHVERRLGCIGCPMAHDRGLKDFLKYPKMLLAQTRALQGYLDAHKDGRMSQIYDGLAENVVCARLFPGQDVGSDPRGFLGERFGVDFASKK